MACADALITNSMTYTEQFSFVELSGGACHYRLSGAVDAPLILMIHGATVPGWEFDRLVPLLNKSGFQTLVPDLYGHGLSARPKRQYDYDLFTCQIEELLRALSIDKPIHLFGHSMGAAIAARLVNQHPDRFTRVILAAPLLNFTTRLSYAMILALPLLGELIMSIYIKPMLRRRRRKRYESIEDGRWVPMFMEHISRRGTGRAILSLFRSGTLGDQSYCYAELQQHPHEVMILRGSEDMIINSQQLTELRQILSRARYVEIEQTPHAFVLTDPELLEPHISQFFSNEPGATAAK